MKDQYLSCCKGRSTRSYWTLAVLIALMLSTDICLALGCVQIMVPLAFMIAVITKVIGIFKVKELIERQRDLSVENVLCPLTRAYNRRYFFERLEERITHNNRKTDKAVSVIMFDLDNFKSVNDTQGHYTGDQVLIETANIVKNIIRQNDIFARLGGEEFILALPETGLDAAASIAERIRIAVAQLTRDAYKVSVSVGVAEWNGIETVDQLYTRVDKLTYASKHRGKNIVTTQEDESPLSK